MKKWITYCWLVALTLISAPAMAQETEYQFGVRWSVNGFASALHIQGIMLDFTGVASNFDRRQPITEYTKTDNNTIELYTWIDEYRAEDKIKVSLLYWELGQNPSTEASTAFEVVMMPGVKDAQPEIVSTDPAAPLQPRESDIGFTSNGRYETLHISFTNRQPMPTWCWEKGDVLRDNDATRDSLAREYRRLHTLFAAGDNDALLAAASTRTAELALASDTPEDYVRHRFSYDMYFDNPDVYQLDDLPDQPMTLNLAAGNRVAWLTEEGVNQPLRFNNITQEGRSAFISIYFIRRDGQWEICR
ncbi:hypothetical protein J7J49_06190 [Halomonas sp. ISL-56]|uniref:hypothetical protein n=1 Tax=Halomonas sp. ISL-56 TaxID=2819149 RepID=UPI001BE81D37|nr:hypothetical protein [Halomonas sp. ISL-56]MBT2800911.1 hypothetical protein [Halomonas sp. ISL-56]